MLLYDVQILENYPDNISPRLNKGLRFLINYLELLCVLSWYYYDILFNCLDASNNVQCLVPHHPTTPVDLFFIILILITILYHLTDNADSEL